jgi:hypothetical protein
MHTYIFSSFLFYFSLQLFKVWWVPTLGLLGISIMLASSSLSDDHTIAHRISLCGSMYTAVSCSIFFLLIMIYENNNINNRILFAANWKNRGLCADCEHHSGSNGKLRLSCLHSSIHFIHLQVHIHIRIRMVELEEEEEREAQSSFVVVSRLYTHFHMA